MSAVDETSRSVDVAVTPPYRVHIGAGLLASLASLVPEQRLAVISDDTVAPLHATRLLTGLRDAGRNAELFTVPAGESSKSLSQYGRILRDLAAAGYSRDSAVLALGGGVVGDLAGFVAATYLRGVAFYQLPTTLLAMVDASVGGKTGLDVPEGKNLVGAFWQPRAVVADVATLATLPEREFKQGTVELYKHGLLAGDLRLLRLFQQGWSADAPAELLAEAVAASVRVKAGVVARDEREGGARAHLNLGHTLAHALESVSDHQLNHGDAVAYGLLYSALLARYRGFADLAPLLLELLNWLRPAPLPRPEFIELLRFMARDKKVAAGKLRFVLLADLGEPLLVDDLSESELTTAWTELQLLMA